MSFVKLALLLFTALGQALAAPTTTASSQQDPNVLHHGGHADESLRSPLQQTLDLLSIAGLVLLGGVFAGLTLALMGLDELHLQVLSSSGTDTERSRATKVLRLLARGKHWVLVVLLLGNVIVNETLPVFLSDFGGGFAAVVTSTALIVIFGEIVPQSVCARYGLAIGAACAPLVHVTMLIFAPVAWPTAKLLDWCLGEDHGTTYRKAELKTFVSLHQTLGAENLSEDEVTIIRAVLDLNDKTVKDVMTPIEDVFILSADTILDEEGVNKLVTSGYSRVPIHEPGKPDAILGMLLVKKLIQYDPEDAMPVSWFNLTPLPEASPDLTLLDCLNYFQQGRSHMLLVSSAPGESEGALGVVTLEDVIEEMIGEEIIDETDVYVDVTNKVRVERKRETGGGAGAWAPLIKGIIERRRKFGGAARTPLRSAYGVPASGLAGFPTPSLSGGRAVNKVQIKRTGSPTSYSEAGYPERSLQYGESRRSSNSTAAAFSPRGGYNALARNGSVDASSPQQRHVFHQMSRQQQQKQKELERIYAQKYGSVPSSYAEPDGGDAAGEVELRGRSKATASAAKGQDNGENGDPEGNPARRREPIIVEPSPNGGGPETVLTAREIPRSQVPSPEDSRRNSRDMSGGDASTDAEGSNDGDNIKN